MFTVFKITFISLPLLRPIHKHSNYRIEDGDKLNICSIGILIAFIHGARLKYNGLNTPAMNTN